MKGEKGGQTRDKKGKDIRPHKIGKKRPESGLLTEVEKKVTKICLENQIIFIYRTKEINSTFTLHNSILYDQFSFLAKSSMVL